MIWICLTTRGDIPVLRNFDGVSDKPRQPDIPGHKTAFVVLPWQTTFSTSNMVGWNLKNKLGIIFIYIYSTCFYTYTWYTMSVHYVGCWILYTKTSILLLSLKLGHIYFTLSYLLACDPKAEKAPHHKKCIGSTTPYKKMHSSPYYWLVIPISRYYNIL